MMNKPELNKLVNKVGCRYALVTAVAKRARQLQDDPEKLGSQKPVSVAVEEIYNGDIVVTTSKED